MIRPRIPSFWPFRWLSPVSPRRGPRTGTSGGDPSRSGRYSRVLAAGGLAGQAAQGLGGDGRDRPLLARRLGHSRVRVRSGRRRGGRHGLRLSDRQTGLAAAVSRAVSSQPGRGEPWQGSEVDAGRSTAAACSRSASAGRCRRSTPRPGSRSGARRSIASSTRLHPTLASRCRRSSPRANVIVHVGGNKSGALMALDAATGTVKWQWKGDGPAYASPVIGSFGTQPADRHAVALPPRRPLGRQRRPALDAFPSRPPTIRTSSRRSSRAISSSTRASISRSPPCASASRQESGRPSAPGAQTRCRCT